MSNTELRTLAKQVRKSLKAAGFKASVRCSGTNTSESLNVAINDMSDETRTRLSADLDCFDGLISEEKAFSNNVKRASRSIVSEIVESIDDFRFVSVSFHGFC